MDENEKKRKRDDEDEMFDIEREGKEQPRQGMKAVESRNKKQKKNVGDSDSTAKDEMAMLKKSAEQKRAMKRERRKAKKAEKLTKALEAKNAQDTGSSVTDKDIDIDIDIESSGDHPDQPAEVEKIDVKDTNIEEDAQSPSSAHTAPESPVFDFSGTQSAASSESSVPPPPPPATSKPVKIIANTEEVRNRLAAKIEALRAARKADGPDGAPARTRQELMEARRKKEEQRRAHKKLLRQKAKEEEERIREEHLSSRNSPAISSSAGLMSPQADEENRFSFGRVTFGDGQFMDADLSNVLDAKKPKGPQDPATALQANEKKQARLSGLDDEKRADIEEKDLWLNAKKRAHGERVRDNTSLLKKALKRKDKAKKKSEREWNERTEGVKKSQDARQKKREENLRRRKEDKGSNAKKGLATKGSKGKVKKRPGFEGSFTAGGRRR
jgi:hypothetical protein